jgi:predicted Zn-dependent protease with MMP-like domain
VEVVVEWRPSPAELRRLGLAPGATLFGLYEGVPLTQRTSGYNLVLPDKITIFRQPIEAYCRSDEQVKQVVRRTVLHELAHHFGISDERLRELGVY